MSDFEEAGRIAAREMWPHVDVRGCWFHFAQSVYRQAVKQGNGSRQRIESGDGAAAVAAGLHKRRHRLCRTEI